MGQTLYLMRHGETLFNQRKKIQGWCDSPLTEKGIRQAQLAGEYFLKQNIEFDAAYSSTSERASDTLEQITNLPYKRVKGLREWNFGILESESEQLNPPLPYKDFFVQFGGEEELEMRERVADTLLSIMENETGNTVLAVSHGAACRQFMRAWAHTSQVDVSEPLKNCCILKFEFENGCFTLLEVINHDFSELQ